MALRDTAAAMALRALAAGEQAASSTPSGGPARLPLPRRSTPSSFLPLPSPPSSVPLPWPRRSPPPLVRTAVPPPQHERRRPHLRRAEELWRGLRGAAPAPSRGAGGPGPGPVLVSRYWLLPARDASPPDADTAATAPPAHAHAVVVFRFELAAASGHPPSPDPGGARTPRRRGDGGAAWQRRGSCPARPRRLLPPAAGLQRAARPRRRGSGCGCGPEAARRWRRAEARARA